MVPHRSTSSLDSKDVLSLREGEEEDESVFDEEGLLFGDSKLDHVTNT